jgi:lipopolysaccharide transport system permease protein
VPYIGFSDAVATTTPSIKANLVLVRNTVFPVELIPVRQLLVSLAGLGFSLAVLIALILPTGFAGWHLLYLPVPLLLLVLFTAGLTWLLSALAVLIPDLNYIVNLLLLLFMFVSPIGFRISQVPPSARLAVLANPMTYLIESFRYALLGLRTTPLWYDAVFGVFALMLAAVGVSFFRTLMPVFSDYE